MKIIYLHQYFNPLSAAGGTRSYEMARRLVSAGHEVHMVSSDRTPGAAAGWTRSEEQGIHVHQVAVPYGNEMSYARRIQAFVQFAVSAARKAASLDGDVIFATSTPLTIALPAVYAARRRKIPMVFEVRDLWPSLPIAIGALNNPLLKAVAHWLERFAYRNARKVVALSPGIKAGVVATGEPADKVSVIPNSCDFEIFDVGPDAGAAVRARYDWLGQRPLVIYGGTLGRINGVDYFARLAAAVHARDPEIRFAVIGNGAEEDKVRECARSLGVLDKSFFMLPPVPKAQMPGWLSAATICTSLFVDLKEMWDNSANKFFDALAAGRPVAINYEGWQSELVREYGAGLLMDVRSVDSAAEALVARIRDPGWLASARAASRRLGQEHFARDNLARELERVLVEAAKP